MFKCSLFIHMNTYTYLVCVKIASFNMQPTFWREVSQSRVDELCRTCKWDMCVAVCCGVLRCVAIHRVISACNQHFGARYHRVKSHISMSYVAHTNEICVLQCVAVCCSVSQCVAVCRSVLQYTESCRTYQWTMSHIRMRYVCCSVLQCVAVCCSVLQCVAGCCTIAHTSCTISYSYDRNKYVYVNLSDNYVYIYLSFLLWDWLSRISEPCHTNECGVLRKHAT